MATTQKQASIARSIIFRSKGVSYSAFLHASTGDLIQQYDDEGNFYPDISAASPIRLTFTATSSRQVGAITPDSITYKVAGVTLAFDNAGKCTTTTNKANEYFRRDGADLLIIGNIAAYLNYASSMIEAIAKKGSDDLYACCPADISEYQGGRKAKVSIAAADDKNFTLTSQDDSVLMKAGVLLLTGWSYDNPNYRYIWEIADPTVASGWRCIQDGDGNGTLEVEADDVNTYANIRCTVVARSRFMSGGLNVGGGLSPNLPSATMRPPSSFDWDDVDKSMVVGSDCVGVLDASDPLDIVYTVKINKTGTGSEVDAEEEALDDTMPAGAYLIYTPTIVIRNSNAPAGATEWLKAMLYDPAGVKIREITAASGKYKVEASYINNAFGEYTLMMTGQLI